MYFWIVFVLSVLVLLVCSHAERWVVKTDTCAVRLRTDAGWVCGSVRRAEDNVNYASFRGVPYGKPPLGHRRFKELEPLDPWKGYLDATEDSPVCPQKDLLYERLALHLKGQTEDCIYLNVHVPLEAFPKYDRNGRVENSPGLPILVMIHGGGFYSGSGLTDIHGPEYLMTKNVILVSFNYRLNVFGFLSLRTKMIPGNQGLRDQVTLLRWVQRNARSFGGDPDNVTIMGQSAGATCAHLLSLSKTAQDLFHKTILMSGSAIPNYFSTSPKYAKDVAEKFLAYAGINSTDPNEIHKQLTEMPLVNIMFANSKVQHEYGLTAFVPVVEEQYPDVTMVLEAEPLELIAQGRGKEYPILFGFTDNESAFFKWSCLNIDIMKRIEDNPNILLTPRHVYNRPAEELPELSNEVHQRYFNGTPTLAKFLEHLSDKFFKYPSFKLATWRAQGGAPAYFYQYSYKSERSLIKEALWTPYDGAAHVEDMTYVFRVNSMLGDYASFPTKNNDDHMKEWMTTIVSNFMRCSNPSCEEDESDWHPLSPDSIQYQNIAEPMVYRMMDPTAAELDMVRFMDQLDVECRLVTEQLESAGTP